ncbi:MAG: outer membrane beta-barrel protein [Verrucomicrobiota bacterium JB022]|nr:outer membrane beta-barrel protein [Verrucomicrobiota bacterium JB022]
MFKKTLIVGLLAASSTLSAEFITGASVGYLFEAEEPMYTARFGYSFAHTAALSGIVEAEIGYTSEDDYDIDTGIIPLMANYRLQVADASSGLSLYVGAGLGFSKVTLDTNSNLGEDDDYTFTWQVLAGIEYAVAENVSLRLGYRYIELDDVKLFEDSWFGGEYEVGYDSAVELGVNFSF